MSEHDVHEIDETAAESNEAPAEAADAAVAESASAEGAPRQLTDAELAQIAELDAAIVKFEGQKRWSDVIKSILQKAQIVVDRDQRIDLFRQAGTLYIERSSNQAEAIKCFEQLLELSPHDADAIAKLKEMYEKRRDWESLVRVMQREAELLPESARAQRYVEMADLATQRLRKPEVCIDLWAKVLETEPTHHDALTNLASLYERAREWEKLAQVLETLVSVTSNETELKNQLQKLGMIYADKTNDDHGAVRAFQRLLTLDPEDKRAQEQLKRRYVAIKAWDELEEFYAPSGKWDELIRLVEREADDTNVPQDERISLLFRVARLWQEKKEQTPRAARSYEKVLELDANNLQAAEALSPIYEAANDAKKLVGVYEVRLRHVTEPEVRVALLRETGLLYEERLKQAETAFERYLEAFSLAPMADVVREDVERVAPGVSGWDRVVAGYTKAIEAADVEDDQIDLRMNLGRVLTQIGKIPEAIRQYRSVYEVRNDHADAIAALGGLYRQTNRYPELLEIYDRRIELEGDSDARRQLAYERAALFENELADADSAVQAYQGILAEWGDDEAEAYRALDRLFESEGRWQDFARTLERRIDLGPPSEEELAALKFRLGRACELHLGQKPRAVELMSEVLTLVPEHDGARLALENLLADAEVGVPAARILEPIYEVRGDHEHHIRALRVLHDGSADGQERLELLTKIGSVYHERIGDAAKAFAALAEALRGAPESEETLGRLEILAAEREAFPELVALVQELAGAVEDPVLSRTLWIKAATMQDSQLGDVDGAVGSYLKCLDIDAGDLEILGALEALYRRTSRWRDLVGVLRRRAELSQDPIEQEDLLAQMAGIHDAQLGEPHEAIRVFKEILEIDPASQRALTALDELFARQAMWSDLADNVDRQLTLAQDPDVQIGLMNRLADLRETKMSAPEAAIEIYRQVLERDASNAPALAALERLLNEPQHQVVIAEILEPIYQAASEFQKLIGVHEIQARHASSPERRVQLLHRIAELYEVAIDDLGSAFSTFARALAEDPANATTQEQLERLARTTGGYEALAKVYEERVQGLEDAALAASLHVKAAEIRETQLGDFQGAIEHYKRVLELDDSHLDAASSLERLYHQGERYEELAKIYLTKSAMLPSVDEQKDYLFRGAATYEEILERPIDAIEVYRQVLTLDPEDLQALDKLIELYLRLEKWESLLEVYTRKADIVDDPDEKKRLYVEVGAVYERELGDVSKAIDTYQRILEIDPEDLTAIGRLDALYQQTQNWQELLSVLEREADLAHEPDEVISYRYRIAELWHRKLGDASRAVDIYREILEQIPDHGPTLAALESMIDEKLVPVSAAGVLEPVYRQAGEFAKLVRVHEVQNEHEEDPARKVELLHQIAQLWEDALDNPAKSFEAYGRALPFDNRNEDTISHLERLAPSVDGWREVTRLYDVEIAKIKAESPADVVDLALRSAKAYESQIGDVDAAIAHHVLVFEADPAHTEAIESLDRLYQATGRWRELAEILKVEIQSAADPEQSLEFQYRLGQVLQHYLGDVDGAIRQYRDILSAAPDHRDALVALEGLLDAGVRPTAIAEILEPLYRMQEIWDRLLGVHEVQLHFLSDATQRVGLMQRIAEIAEERMADGSLALAWHQRALLEDAANEQSIGEAERLAGVLGEWAGLADTYASAIEATSNAEAKVDLGRRQARIFEEELGDTQRAEGAYRFVLSVKSSDEESLAALDRIYLAHGAHESLADVLKRRIAVSDRKDDQIELSYRLGHVLEDDLHRTDEAISVYRRILSDLDPEHLEAVRALEDIYTRRSDWPNLYAAFAKELEIVFGDTQRADLLARMARLASDKLGDPTKSVQLWRQVLEIRGEDLEALNAIGNILTAQKNWRDLVDILEREAEEARAQGNEELCIQVYTDLGRIWYSKLGKPEKAIECWEQVLGIEPVNTEALFQIAEIHRAASNWHDVAQTLHRVIDVGAAVLPDATLEHCYMQLGSIYKNQLEQPMDAADAYRSVLDINPRNFDALAGLELIHRDDNGWDDVVGVMEKRAAVLDDAESRIGQLLAIAATHAEQLENADGGTSAFQRILEIAPLHEYAFQRLETLHTEAGRWEDLTDLYVTRYEHTENVRERVGLLSKAAKVYETKLDDLEQAFSALQIAWEEDYTNRATARELERVTAAASKWNELLTAANAALQQVTDPEIKIAICLNCAKWYGAELGHPEYAIPYYQQILALDPGNVPAMQQMADLYRSTQQWDTLAQVLGRLVEMTKDPAILSATYVQMGDLAENQLGVPDQAPGFYLKALEIAPSTLSAMVALERIYREQMQWPAYLDILQKKVGVLTADDEIVEAKLLIGETFEDRIRDAAKAIDTYRDVLKTDATNLRALKGLERLYSQTQKWTELMEVLETELDVVQTERERIAILVWMASMWEEEFLKPERAAQRLEQVVDIAPNHEGALNGLERLYRAMKKWDQLIDTYERHVQATPDRGEKIRCYKAIGEVHQKELDDVDRAIDSYLNVLGVEEHDQEALDVLSRLYTKRGDHSSALDMMGQLIRLVSDPARQVDLAYRMGQVLDNELGDRGGALEQYRKATDLEPAHLPSLEAMRKIQLDSGEWLAAAKTLDQEARFSENPRVKAQRLVELGRLYDNQLEEHDRAVQCYEQALESDADSEEAALPLVDVYTRTGRHPAAFPLLKMLVKGSAKRDGSEQHRLSFMLGTTAMEVGDTDEAIKAFAKAHQLESGDLPTLIGLAGAHFAAKDWNNAAKFYQMLLMHRDSLDPEQYTDILYRLGVTKREQGEKPKALNFFDKALAEDSHHLPTLEAVVGLYSEQSNWEQVIHFKKQILDVKDEIDDRFALYDQIGDLWKEKLKNHPKAIEAYVEASVIKPENHVVLHKLLESYQATKQWPDVINTIDRVAELDGRPTAKAKYAYTVGVILRDELKDVDGAVERFNAALDIDAEQLKPFEAINKILTAKKDWKALERAYRKMLHRIIGKGQTDLEFNFWHTLGLIYRDRQKNFEAAAEAFRMASSLKPDEITEHQILAELYGMIPARVGEAIAEHQWLLRQDPYAVDSYKALYRLYFEARQYDRAWCLAATLSFLKKADQEQTSFYQQYRQPGLIRPSSRVDNERWIKELFAPDEDRFVSKMMEILAIGVWAAKAVNDKQLNLTKEKPVDVANSTVTFVKTFGFVQQVLNIQMPVRLYLMQNTPGGLVDVVGSNPPAIKAGNSLLSNYTPQDLAFVTGRHLAYYRPEHFVRRLLTSHTELGMVLRAGLRLAGIIPADPQVDAWAQQIGQSLSATQLDALRQVARRFVDAGGSTDIKRWMQNVELTAIRAGFLVCNDLETAARMIQQLPPDGSVDLPPKDKIKELVLFSISDSYFNLREALGIQIQV
ncbi:MAG: hypothetical protein U0230_08245 [Polyangiales bacterium]